MPLMEEILNFDTPIWDECADTPVVREIQDGTLPLECFAVNLPIVVIGDIKKAAAEMRKLVLNTHSISQNLKNIDYG